MTGKIFIVGIGPGSSEYLTKKAIDTVKTSDYTVGSTRAIELFDDVNNKIAFNVKELRNCWTNLKREFSLPAMEIQYPFCQQEIPVFQEFLIQS